jgi:hypothetical protein
MRKPVGLSRPIFSAGFRPSDEIAQRVIAAEIPAGLVLGFRLLELRGLSAGGNGFRTGRQLSAAHGLIHRRRLLRATEPVDLRSEVRGQFRIFRKRRSQSVADLSKDRATMCLVDVSPVWHGETYSWDGVPAAGELCAFGAMRPETVAFGYLTQALG